MAAWKTALLDHTRRRNGPLLQMQVSEVVNASSIGKPTAAAKNVEKMMMAREEKDINRRR